MLRKLFLITFIAIFTCACDSNNSEPKVDGDGFDREALLINMADNIIIPAYQDLDSKLSNLVTAKNTYTTTVSQSNLSNLRAAWLEAYKTWQHVEMFNIGKAEEVQYFYQMNIYPTNSTEIEENIASQSYDLGHVNNYDAVGFPAIDYLLNGLADNDDAILEKYTTDANAEKYRIYLSNLIDRMQELTETVLTDWEGSYRDTFVSSTSNTSSSSVNNFVNDFIFYFEKGLRANKIGIPAGVYSTNPLADKVEAVYYKTASKDLTLEALSAVQDVFNGKHYQNTTTGEGLKSYLMSLDRADLANSINDQFDVARAKIQTMDANFATQIATDNTKMTQSFDALQTAVVLLKVDMLAALRINIDYVDGDGD
jgi:predicted lipoprotein